MTASKTMLRIVLASVLGAALLLAAAPEAYAACGACGSGKAHGGITVGSAHSVLTEAVAAGTEAAKKAKAALGKDKAKVVLVFDSIPGKADVKQKVLDGVATVFDKSIIYGCSAYDAITQDCNVSTVGVLALGGDINVASATANLDGGWEACGKKIGEAIKPAVEKTKDHGQLLVLIGDCHVNKNDALAKGVCSVLGEKFPTAGAAANGGLTYVKGKVLTKSNLGLLLSGHFKPSFSAKKAKGKKPMDVVQAAGDAFEQAIGKNQDKLVMVFAFDCGGRRQQMKGQLPKELELMKAAAGKAPIFGFYGSGETGPKDNDSAPRGVGYHIAACALIKTK